jgi:hypothetical protein
MNPQIFSSFLIVLLFVIATLMAVTVYREFTKSDNSGFACSIFFSSIAGGGVSAKHQLERVDECGKRGSR